MNDRPPDLNWTVPCPGETVAGKYVVEGPCGRGGLAAVLSAMHVGLDQRVALKVLLPQWAGDAAIVERFLREGRAATSIRSEHVVRVFDVGTLESGAPYLVLEYLDGHNLDDVITMWGPLPVATAVDWVLQAAEAIGEAHALGIVHRDIKPANLFLTKRADGSSCIKVIDFGLSKITDPKIRGATSNVTQPKEVFGSPHYMAPEQLRAARDAGAPADLWSLGAVLHELLTGQPPFPGETMAEICATVLTQAPTPVSSLRPSVPAAIEMAILRCLEKEPGDRFRGVVELAAALAPFGTVEASESCSRIERVLDRAATGEPSFRAMLALPPWPEEPEENSSEYLVGPAGALAGPRAPITWRAPASPSIVMGGLFMLGAVAVAILMGLHSVVHADQRPLPDSQRPLPDARGGAAVAEAQAAPNASHRTAAVAVSKPRVVPQGAKALQPQPPALHRTGLVAVERPAAYTPATTVPAKRLPFLTLPPDDPLQSSSAPHPGPEVVLRSAATAAPQGDDNFESQPTRQ